jgi:TolA-binding protein
MSPRHSLIMLLIGSVAACTSTRPSAPPEAPTLKSLASRSITLTPDPGIPANEQKAIAAYRDFLKAAPRAPQRAEIMRRLGDLEMDSADAAAAESSGGAPDYRAAIARYLDYLNDYPQSPGNDRVLYQLARAYEQSGALEDSLKILDTLVGEYPQTMYRDEAEFRRGEMLFTLRDYARAEQAYATVLQGNWSTPFHDRALYMQGWSLFKQGRLDEALYPFFAVLDLKFANADARSQYDGSLESVTGFTRADRELVEDTFRVTSLCLANLQGAASIPAYITTPQRRAYEFRVYEQLGELYLKQERVKDAADTFAALARRNPQHAQAPLIQARVIAIYQQAGFANMALDAKKEYVERYGVDSDFRKANASGWARVLPILKSSLAELARHYHASAQKTKSSADYQEAVRWYRSYLASFPDDPQAAQNNFLLAELLYEDQHYAEAAVEYEKSAYRYPHHAKSADAGYAALLAYAALEKGASGDDAVAIRRTSVENGLRFATAFPDDPRVSAVLTNAADKLYALHDSERAASVSQLVLALKPPADAKQRRVAWTIVAHTAFDAGAFDRAEQGYSAVLALTPEQDPARKDLVERLAASVYKQGERARVAGKLADAVVHFNRVATLVPTSTIRATAQYDAAATQIAMKNWDAAIRNLEDFRTRYPRHPLQDEVSNKLAAAYLERGQWAKAAAEFERFAATRTDPKQVRTAIWQSAELYEKAGAQAAAGKGYERYLKQFPAPLEAAIEARYRLAGIARQDGDSAREAAYMKAIFQADQGGGAARTDRTRYLGATAALALAEPGYVAYRKIALVEPLNKTLKRKKAKMEEVLKAYTLAADYGVADVTTAATFHIAGLYQDFGKALMTSQRPRKLSRTELEQYDLMLEEQAYPFEEKAIEIHEINARRTRDGLYDAWIKKSFAALEELQPVRYRKAERSEGAINAIR